MRVAEGWCSKGKLTKKGVMTRGAMTTGSGIKMRTGTVNRIHCLGGSIYRAMHMSRRKLIVRSWILRCDHIPHPAITWAEHLNIIGAFENCGGLFDVIPKCPFWPARAYLPILASLWWRPKIMELYFRSITISAISDTSSSILLEALLEIQSNTRLCFSHLRSPPKTQTNPMLNLIEYD